MTEHLSDLRHPVVLGHSGAGLIIEAVGRALDATHLVWLAAYIPAEGMSLLDEDLESVFDSEWLGVDPTDNPDAATRFLYYDCDRETLAWALNHLRLWNPGATAMHPGAPRGEAAPPSSVVVASRDRTIRPAWLREAARSRLGTEPIDIDAGHCPHVSQPELLADVVNSAIVADKP